MVEHFLQSISHVMNAIGESLRQNAPLKIDDAWLTAMHVETEALREAHETAERTFLVSVVRDARRQMDAISGQIRTAIKMAGDITPEGFGEKPAERKAPAVEACVSRASFPGSKQISVFARRYSGMECDWPQL